MKILIAEDDAVSRLALHSALVRLGHEVSDARDGLEAAGLFRREYFPVVVSDWVMPGLDGPGLCRAIRSGPHAKYTYVILVTILDARAHYVEGLDAGADDFVSKPVDWDALQARLRVAERILSLQEEVKQLKGLLPTCMYCKKIRDDASVWVPIEQYLARRTEASFSHGVCPECLETRLKPELERARVRRQT